MNRFHLSTFLLAFLLTLPLIRPAEAQPRPDADSLLAAYTREAWETHPDLESMRAMITVESSRARMGAAWMNPMLRFGLMNVPESFDTHMDPNTMWQVGVAQQVPFPGKTRAARQAGALQTQAAAASYEEARYRMAGMVAEAYYDLAAALKVRHLLIRGAALAADMTAAATAVVTAGTGSQAEVYRGRVEEENWKVKLTQSAAEIDRKRATLAYAVGREDPATLTDPVMPDSLPPDIDLDAALAADSVAASPTIQRAQLEADAAAAEVKRARLEYYPSVELMASVGFRGYLRTMGADPHTGAPVSGRVPQDKMISLEVSAPLPLFFKGNQGARAAEMRAMQQSREADVRRARLAKRQELRDLAARWRESVDCCRIEQGKVLPQVQDEWRAMLIDYRSGMTSFASLSEAQMKVVMAEMDVVMHKADGWMVYRQWQAALGVNFAAPEENVP